MKRSFYFKVITASLLSLNLFSCTSENNLSSVLTKPTATPNISNTNDSTQNYSGIIIDCRGLNVSAAMSPVIYDEESNNIFPANIELKSDFIINEGIVSYSYSSMENAQKNSRSGESPLIIKAIKADGINNFNVIISNQDSLKIKEINKNSAFLNNFKVVFLLD